ncbi:MAG: hypothetical protein AAGA56_01140 [Myxococcota bacterium]
MAVLRPWWFALLCVAGCGPSSTDTPSRQNDAISSGRPPAPAMPAAVAGLQRAAAMRDVAAVSDELLRDADARVRRAAVRTLAVAGTVAQREALSAALADEDDATVAWAAWGLGRRCAGARESTIRALVAAAARHAGPARPGGPRGSIVLSIGRCGTELAESVLAEWVAHDGRLGERAVEALVEVARQRRRLRESTLVALLQRAEGDARRKPDRRAFRPIGELSYVVPGVAERIEAAARKALAVEAMPTLVRALARAGGEEAVPTLRELALNEALELRVRLRAVVELATLARPGQRALGVLLKSLGQRVRAEPPQDERASLVLLGETLESLRDTRKLTDALRNLAQRGASPDASARQLRLLARVRCRAAQLALERRYDDPLLRRCDPRVTGPDADLDPHPSAVAAEAIVDAVGVDAVRLTGRRLEVWRHYATAGAPGARARALRQLIGHDEVPRAASILSPALTDRDAPVVIAAAHVLAQKPARGTTAEGTVDPATTAALKRRLDDDTRPVLQVAAVRAAGALGLADLAPDLQRLCRARRRSYHRPAEGALQQLLGPSSPRCSPTGQLGPPQELAAKPTPQTVRIMTDAGPIAMRIDPSLAPLATTRWSALFASGVLRGKSIRRAGDRLRLTELTSVALDTTTVPPLPPEPGPHPWPTKGALLWVPPAGLDLASDDLEIVLEPDPAVLGRGSWLGTADGPWDELIVGAIIEEIEFDP